MQEPGHSSRGSGIEVVAGAWVVVATVCGRLVCGRGRCVDATLELSQHTDPLLQLTVREMRIEGRSQKAVIIFGMQNPGHRGNGGCKKSDFKIRFSLKFRTPDGATHGCCNPLRSRLDLVVIGTSGHATASLARTERLRVNVIAKERKESTDTLTFAFFVHLTLTLIRNRSRWRLLLRPFRGLLLRLLWWWICLGLWWIRVHLKKGKFLTKMKYNS